MCQLRLIYLKVYDFAYARAEKDICSSAHDEKVAKGGISFINS